MNTVHIREEVKAMLKAGVITEQFAKVLLTEAPIFLHDGGHPLTEDEEEWCRQNICGEETILPVKLPYQTFILRVENKAQAEKEGVPEGVIGMTFYVTGVPFTTKWGRNADSQETCRLFVVRHGKMQNSATGKLRNTYASLRYNGRVKKGVMVSLWVEGKPFDLQEESLAKGFQNIVSDCILRFCFDVMNPVNTVLRVSERKPGKTVGWHFAREHFLVLPRKQAQACQKGKRGPTDKEIERAAHYRRAHMRRLMSEMFTHKRGQSVFVRQAWIGPEEWEGLDDKVYKVVTMPKQEALL